MRAANTSTENGGRQFMDLKTKCRKNPDFTEKKSTDYRIFTIETKLCKHVHHSLGTPHFCHFVVFAKLLEFMNSFICIDKSGCEKYNLFVTRFAFIFVTNITKSVKFKIKRTSMTKTFQNFKSPLCSLNSSPLPFVSFRGRDNGSCKRTRWS